MGIKPGRIFEQGGVPVAELPLKILIAAGQVLKVQAVLVLHEAVGGHGQLADERQRGRAGCLRAGVAGHHAPELLCVKSRR